MRCPTNILISMTNCSSQQHNLTNFYSLSQNIPSNRATTDSQLMKQCRSCWRLVLASDKSQSNGSSSVQTPVWTSTSLVDMWYLQRSHTIHSGWRWLCLDRGGILRIYRKKNGNDYRKKLDWSTQNIIPSRVIATKRVREGLLLTNVVKK